MRTPTEILAAQGRDADKEARRFLANLQKSRKTNFAAMKIYPGRPSAQRAYTVAAARGDEAQLKRAGYAASEYVAIYCVRNNLKV
jgi:hypothetical protein